MLGRCTLPLELLHLCLIRQLGHLPRGALVSELAYEIAARLGGNPSSLLADGVHALGLSIRGVLICDFVYTLWPFDLKDDSLWHTVTYAAFTCM